MHGTVHGGQQPITSSTIQLYAAATTGYAAASVPVGPGTTTDSSGNFDLGNIACTSGTYLYITATGGNPGAGTNNNVALFAALGPCDNVNSIPAVSINEVTTVGSAYALGAFMSGPLNLGTSTTNIAGLGLAFADVNQLVNITTGLPSGPSLPTGAKLPVAEINTLADSVASCINSTGGAAGSNTLCGTFFTATTPPSGTAPTDTITAALNIVHYPAALDIPTIYSSASASSPFQPTLGAAPNDFTLAVNYVPAGLTNPSGIAFDSAGTAYISDRAAASVFEVAHSGALTLSVPTTGAVFTSVAIDAATSPNFLSTNTTSGTPKIRHYPSANYNQTLPLNGPSDAALDQNGLVWITYATDSALTQSDAGINTFNTYQGSGINYPLGIAISNK